MRFVMQGSVNAVCTHLTLANNRRRTASTISTIDMDTEDEHSGGANFRPTALAQALLSENYVFCGLYSHTLRKIVCVYASIQITQ